MIQGVDHIAIAVASLDDAVRFYEQALGLNPIGREKVLSNQVEVCFLPVGDTRLELVQPDAPDSPVARFLEQRGPGLHHICLRVDDLATELMRLKAAGVRLIDESPRTGAHGNLVAFIHPKAAGGVLIELVQKTSAPLA